MRKLSMAMLVVTALGTVPALGADPIPGRVLQRWLETAFVLAVYRPASRTSELIRFRRDEVETFWTVGVGFRGIWQGWASVEGDALCLRYLQEPGVACFALVAHDAERGELRSLDDYQLDGRYIVLDPPFMVDAP